MTKNHWKRLAAKYSYDSRTGVIMNKRTKQPLDYAVNGIMQMQVMYKGVRKTVPAMAFAYYIMTGNTDYPRLMPMDGNYNNLKWKNLTVWEPRWMIEERELLKKWNKRR